MKNQEGSIRAQIDEYLAAPLSSNDDTAIHSLAQEAAQNILSHGGDEDIQGTGSEILNAAQEQNDESNIHRLVPLWLELEKSESSTEDDQIDWAIRDEWNYFDPSSDDSDQAESREKWRKLNMFVALLAAHGDESVLLNGLWTLRSALEDGEGVQGNLPAAAMWVIHAGDIIFNSTNDFKPQSSKGGDPAKPGKNFNGQSGFSKARWDFWKDGFSAAKTNSKLNSETRDWAGNAAEVMVAIESDS